MINEFKSKEVNETKNPESNHQAEIKAEKSSPLSEIKNFWKDTFSKISDEFKSDILNGDQNTGNEKQSISNDIKKNSTAEINEVSNSKEYYDDNGELYRIGDSLKPNTTSEINGYKYNTDNQGRVISAEGKLQLRENDRKTISDSRSTVAHGEMKETDDRGHLIGDRFNGDNSLENLVPMDLKLNRGDYAKLEGTLAKAVSDGADVYYKVEPVYNSKNAFRPDEFRVSYSINGEKEIVVFKNGGN
ncbi:MAG TPA: DNA/RNA non-specific endonuclease [Candidatus Fimiplasma intestinipullorum]|uniref:DNA/RNA non-specific endonuclease n=1 Tax=Candidatus Fimiplasma intestinipullorum TaxID=2840825 RepID=A0A9D1HLU4_9FIRM|nr:DNA/RNA non-specific endonuclease [Candidatus Fimiplasma intestinipullorum]